MKVYGTDKTVKNYVGSLTELLDNEPSEDSYTYLILSAQTKQYELKVKYTPVFETTSSSKATLTEYKGRRTSLLAGSGSYRNQQVSYDRKF